MRSEDFNTEFIECKDMAYRYAVSLLHDTHAAQDIIQDLYEKLWRRRLFIVSGHFVSLIMVSTRNMCFDRMRERQRNRIFAPIEAAERCCVSEQTADEMTAVIGALIAALPQREREVMHLRDTEGLEFDRIAQITGQSETAARMACSRARSKVKQQLVKIMNHGL